MARLLWWLWIVIALSAVAPAYATPVPMRIAVSTPVFNRGWATYRVRIIAPGAALAIFLPPTTEHGLLETNGMVVQRVGMNESTGTASLGHAETALILRDLTVADQVVVRVTAGSAPALTAMALNETLVGMRTDGMLAGAFYAVIITIALSELASLCSFFDATNAWYSAYLLALLVVELTRDGVLSVDQPTGAKLLVVATALGFGCFFGFVATFLRLSSAAPRSIWVGLAGCVLPVLAVGIYDDATGHLIDNTTFLIADLISILFVDVIVIRRFFAGYPPAKYLALATFGMTMMLLGTVAANASHVQIPCVHWSYEIGELCDVFAFSASLAYRSKFILAEGQQLSAKLDAATFAARHDPLTGLLNRRGLEQACSCKAALSAVVLFLDVDGFKAVNDGGGHAAGDATLQAIARIVNAVVRQEDFVARVGGDEFVVVMPDASVEDVAHAAVVERICHSVAGLHPLGFDNPVRIGVSIGIGELTPQGTLDAALAQADAAAYNVKQEHHRVMALDVDAFPERVAGAGISSP